MLTTRKRHWRKSREREGEGEKPSGQRHRLRCQGQRRWSHRKAGAAAAAAVAPPSQPFNGCNGWNVEREVEICRWFNLNSLLFRCCFAEVNWLSQRRRRRGVQCGLASLSVVKRRQRRFVFTSIASFQISPPPSPVHYSLSQKKPNHFTTFSFSFSMAVSRRWQSPPDGTRIAPPRWFHIQIWFDADWILIVWHRNDPLIWNCWQLSLFSLGPGRSFNGGHFCRHFRCCRFGFNYSV